MSMKFCYCFENGTFVEAKSPLNTKTESLYSALTAAGYFPQLQTAENTIATVYQHLNGNNGVPYFLIDLWGEESQIAMLVAADLNQLLSTMKAIEPLLGIYPSIKSNSLS